MAKTKVFISFDYENDRDIKGALISQAKQADSPFSINDCSIQFSVPNTTRWQKIARDNIKKADLVIVLCGLFTDKSDGVAAEVTIAQEEGKPYFLLKGRRRIEVKRPKNVKNEERIIPWNWKKLSEVIRKERV
jgi:hypothetical protein